MTENNVEVSLIIPVYNMEKHLEKCLESAINQTFENIEIIVVNDGSKDNSLNIITKFAQMDNRIVVINQSNKGLSYSRNEGIKAARGEYIAFADSDDFFSKLFIEKMYTAAKKNNADIVICNYKKVSEKSKKVYTSSRKFNKPKKIISSKEALKKLIIDIKINNYAWDKLYKRNLFVNNDTFYPVGMSYEDLATTYKLFFHSKIIVCIDDCLYYYLQRRTSITRSYREQHFIDILKALGDMKCFLIENGVFEDYKKEFNFLCTKTMNVIIAKAVKHKKLRNVNVKEMYTKFYDLLEK